MCDVANFPQAVQLLALQSLTHLCALAVPLGRGRNPCRDVVYHMAQRETVRPVFRSKLSSRPHVEAGQIYTASL